MNRKAITSFLCVFSFGLFLLFVSCNNNKQSMFKADNGVEFDTINIEKKHFLDNNPENPSCNLTLKFIYPKNITHFNTQAAKRVFLRALVGTNYDSLSVDEAIEKYTQSYIENYQNDAKIYKVNKPYHDNSGHTLDDMYLSDDEHEHEDELLPEIFYSYFENLSDSIVYNHYGVIAFQVKQINNKGGKMSYETTKNYVLDLSTGTLLTEGDIFSGGYDMALRPLIQNALMEANGVKSIGELEDLGYFGIDEILPNKNFLINAKGITYTFNKGEYSAYQLDAPVVFIPYDAVRLLLRDNSIVSKLSRL